MGGLMRSEDGGETWDDHRLGPRRAVVLLFAGGTLHAALSDGTTYARGDGCKNWTPRRLHGEPPTRVVALAGLPQ